MRFYVAALCNIFASLGLYFLRYGIGQGSRAQTFEESTKDTRWVNAMKQEISTLHEYNTREVIALPPNKKSIGCKWVYKVKYYSDGSINRYNILLKDVHKRKNDSSDAFLLVVKMITVRTILCIATAKRWILHQMDVNNVFFTRRFE